MIDNFIKFFIGLIQGLWNNFGILGRLLAIGLSPIAFAILLTLYVFKFGFVLLRIMVDEVNFYIRKWIEASRKTKELLDELLTHKIIPALKWLFQNLLEDKTTWEGLMLRSNWRIQLLYSFLGQFYFGIGILLLLISTSSFIYFLNTIGPERDYTVAWLLRMALLLPVAHRYFRYQWAQKPFSWKSESNRFGDQPFRWDIILFGTITLFALLLLMGIYGFLWKKVLILSILSKHIGFESFLAWGKKISFIGVGLLGVFLWIDDKKDATFWGGVIIGLVVWYLFNFLLLFLGYGWMYFIYHILA